MAKFFIIAGALSGFLTVALGAFGAHALKAKLSPELLEIYQTGVNYQSIHTLALLLVGVLSLTLPAKIPLLSYSGWFFIAGIIIFSGSLYLLSFTGIKTFGAITPIGGLAFLAGWVLLGIGVFRSL